jgi:hypothetical protein
MATRSDDLDHLRVVVEGSANHKMVGNLFFLLNHEVEKREWNESFSNSSQ